MIIRLFLPRFYSKSVLKPLYRMNAAYFKLDRPNDDQLQITFHYINSLHNVNRIFNFRRSVNENLNIASERIKNNLEKAFNKKAKNKNKAKCDEKEKEQPAITVKFFSDNEEASDRTFSDLIADVLVNKNVEIRILGDPYHILYNQPCVNSLTLPTSILAGFYVYPAAFDIQFSNRNECLYEWFRGVLPTSKNVNSIIWESIGTNYTYYVKNSDVDHHLKIVCIPINNGVRGLAVEYISKCVVEAGPGVCPFDTRHLFTAEKLKLKQFRVTTYNLLADLYANSDYSRKELFPYCPEYALNINYRKQLFIKELIGYQSDIICLQEVDKKIFSYDLMTILAEKSYSGCFKMKGTTAEGLATFYDNQRFLIVDENSINIGDEITNLEIFKELYNKIKYNAKLELRVTERSTAIQTVILQSKELKNKYLLIANTHLYFHPNADHVRLLQIGFCMLYVQYIYDKTIKKYGLNNDNISVIFCGDFNSVPECGIYKLLTEKFVPEDFIDWNSCQEEAVKNVSLTQNFNMESACGCPQYTNYTPFFKECLDYIFFQTDYLQVNDYVPLPSEEELSAHIAIPSVSFPSDHVALCANLEWKN